MRITVVPGREEEAREILDSLPTPRSLPDEQAIDDAFGILCGLYILEGNDTKRALLREALEKLAGEEPE